MAAAKRISATKLAKETADILDRVAFKGERFVVERRGKVICRIAPMKKRKRCTGAELADALDRFHLGDDFALVVKDAKKSLLPPSPPSW